jgi:predicted CoA-binding protein
MNVAILGASANPGRYAFKAAERLAAAGHQRIGVNPTLPQVPNLEVVPSIEALPREQHTLTVYVSPEKSSAIMNSILGYGFSRVIFNPGAENPNLEQRLRQAGVEVVEGCTLVMLSTGAF